MAAEPSGEHSLAGAGDTDDAPQRIEERVAVNGEFVTFGGAVEAYACNVSRTGVFVRCTGAPPVGTRVSFRLLVVGDEVVTLEGIGDVVRTQFDPPGVGIVFVKLTDPSVQLIESLLVQRAAV